MCQLVRISCQFLSPGGSMSPRHILQFFKVKNHQIVNNSSTAEATEKLITNLESLNFRNILMYA
jgi:hypothetical protein